jgi:hypothetical protein
MHVQVANIGIDREMGAVVARVESRLITLSVVVGVGEQVMQVLGRH